MLYNQLQKLKNTKNTKPFKFVKGEPQDGGEYFVSQKKPSKPRGSRTRYLPLPHSRSIDAGRYGELTLLLPCLSSAALATRASASCPKWPLLFSPFIPPHVHGGSSTLYAHSPTNHANPIIHPPSTTTTFQIEDAVFEVGPVSLSQLVSGGVVVVVHGWLKGALASQRRRWC